MIYQCFLLAIWWTGVYRNGAQFSVAFHLDFSIQIIPQFLADVRAHSKTEATTTTKFEEEHKFLYILFFT